VMHLRLMDLLSKAATIAMLSFVVSSMLAMGTGLLPPLSGLDNESGPLPLPHFSLI
jgi:hypothetical protein